MYNFKVSDYLQEIMKKLYKKNRKLYERLLAKIQEVISSDSIEYYKNLRYNRKDSKRVHIGHFVLLFQYNSAGNEILFDDFDHHDNIYK